VAIDNSDGLVIGSEEISDDLKAYIEKSELPTLPYVKREEMANAYQTYYLRDILNEEEE
jgi:starch synthase